MLKRVLSIWAMGTVVLALGTVRSASAEDLSCRITLVLNDAVLQQRSADAPVAGKPLVLDLTATDGQFDRVWGIAESFNKAEHQGNVVEVSATPDRVKLKVRMRIESDAWIKGGRATYDLDLVRSGEKLTGRFTGRWNGLWTQKDIAGEATGTISPIPPVPANVVPPQSGEHPRLLFRKSEIPALREKIKSGVGQAAYEHLQRSTHPVALGVLYQLAGEAKYALAAIKPTQDKMNEKGNGYLNLGHEWGERIKTVAYAYDLCCDAWAAQDPDFKKKVELHLYYMGERSLLRMNTLSQYPNMDFGSNYSAHIRSGGAIASLALWGEKGPAPQEPRDPGVAPIALTPPADFAPADSLPVNDLGSGQMPTRWIHVGPFKDEFDAGQDFLTSLGGPDQAYKSIKPDTEVRVGDTASRFRPTDPATHYQGAIDLMAAFDKKMESTGYFFTTVKVDAPKLVRFTGPNTTWIGSRRIWSGDYLQLAAGTYPLLVRSRLPSINPWGKAPVAPTFTIVPPEEARKDLAIRQAEHKEALLDYRFDMQQWDKSGRIDPRAAAMFQIGRNHAARYYRSVMGDDGFQGEGEEYTLSSCSEFLEYAHCYWRMLGQQVTGQLDVANFAPRYVMTTLFAPGKLFQQDFGYSHDQTMHAGQYARSFAYVRPEWQPAVLWAWNQAMGLSGAPAASDLSRTKVPADAEAAIFTLVNYPADPHPRNPGEVLPHFWNGTTKGLFVFRDRWTEAKSSPEDLVAQIYARQAPNVGWNQDETGCFQIFGLGHAWNTKGQHVKRGSRWLDSVVMLPDDDLNLGGHGRVTFARGDAKTGSGVITTNLDDVYRGRKTEITGKDAKGADQKREVIFDAGIRGLRSFAVDYSGTCGAPALFAVVDQITGGGRREWLFQLPKGADSDVKIDGNAFTLTQGDASLRVSFITPARPSIRIMHEAKRMTNIARTGVPEEWKDVPLNCIAATGEPRSEGFFVIVTLSRGQHPQVQWTGDGLHAAVRIGEQFVRFDGEKIIIGK